MSNPKEGWPTGPQTEHVTYVVVVHGIGEQRKNECVINVVNRFAEARRRAGPDDNRDVLTLGKASSQTGFSKVPATEQPWLEFDQIPASPAGDPVREPFLGEPAKNPGENLRFVDVCWSDVMHDSIEHVGQDVDLWAKGLLGRLLRKHKAAETAAGKAETEEEAQAAEAAKVPLWIRRVLYLLADTLLLVRFAMSFRFKEMKELVFVKFLGDIQLYGEYDRCRGQAVRRFHELMAKVEAKHEESEQKRETPREARYAVIAHSLGSIMSLDALLYASAKPHVRRGDDDAWKFRGYLRDDDESDESGDLAKLNRLRQKSRRTNGVLSAEENRDLHALDRKFTFLDTRWIHRVRSFVTLGSPIDKYLTIWWLNYQYLLKDAGRLQSRKSPRIAHFNYCDEADPVGNKLDVVQQTPVYDSVFRGCEDVVFNRYSTPGAAHNKYWTDQRLFRWILYWAVDKDESNVGKPPKRPRWFRPKTYWLLLFWLYSLIPLIVLLGTYGSLSLAFLADGWRTAAVAAAAFSFMAYSGSRLVDLSIWWRQIQRKKSRAFWEDGQPSEEERSSRKWAGRTFWGLAFAAPIGCVALAGWTAREFTSRVAEARGASLWHAPFPPCSSEGCSARLLVVLAVLAAVGLLVASRRRAAAYRVPAHDPKYRTKVETASLLAGAVATTVLALLFASRFACPSLAASTGAVASEALPTAWWGQLALLGVVATAIYAYRLYRFLAVKYMLHSSRLEEINYEAYASDAPCVDDT